MAAIDKALPASVPPIPPTSTKSIFLLLYIFYDIYLVTPNAPHGIPPPILLPIVIISGCKLYL